MAHSKMMLCLAVVAVVALVAEACMYNRECGPFGQCVNGFCKGVTCIYDANCGPSGRCVNGFCLVVVNIAGIEGIVNNNTIECRANIDCLPRGIYTKCSNGKCVNSSHKICITNSDCKKNLLNRKCKNNRCV